MKFLILATFLVSLNVFAQKEPKSTIEYYGSNGLMIASTRTEEGLKEVTEMLLGTRDGDLILKLRNESKDAEINKLMNQLNKLTGKTEAIIYKYKFIPRDVSLVIKISNGARSKSILNESTYSLRNYTINFKKLLIDELTLLIDDLEQRKKDEEKFKEFSSLNQSLDYNS